MKINLSACWLVIIQILIQMLVLQLSVLLQKEHSNTEKETVNNVTTEY
jgi:hypothetical protein